MTRYVPIALVLVLAAPALAETRTDLLGDPLPEGAVARIGSVRYRIGKVGPYALSPDGKTLAVEGPLGVMLWDVETGKPQLRISLRGHSMCDIDRTPMGFTPDGKNLVWVYGDELRVCDVATGRTRFGAQLPHALVAVGFLPGTTRFAVLESTGKVFIFDWETGRKVSTIDAGTAVSAMSRSGRFMLGKWNNEDTGFVDARDGRVRVRFADTRDLSDSVYVLSPDDRRLYVTAPSGRLRTYDTETGKKLEELAAPPGWDQTDARDGLALSPDGTIAYLSTRDLPIQRRDLKAGKWLAPLPVATGWRLIPLPDGKRVLVLGDDGVLRRYDLATLKEIPTGGFAEHVSACASPDGRRIAVVSGEEPVRLDLFDATGKSIWSVPELADHLRPSWSPDGRSVVLVGRREITLRDPATGKLVRTLKQPDKPESFDGTVTFTADNRVVAPFDQGQFIAVFDATTGKRSAVVATGAPASVAVSPDGRTAAADRRDRDITFLDLLTQKAVRLDDRETPGCKPYKRGEIAFSPDGSYLLTWDEEWFAVLRDPNTGVRKRTFPVGQSNYETFAFSPDGLWLATGRPDGLVALWDVTTGDQVWSEYGHPEAVTRVEFAGAGHLLTSSNDLTALVWDLRSRYMPKKPLWEALSGDNADEAYRAVCALAADPQAPSILRARVPAAMAPPAAQVEKWIADLAADSYRVREAASVALSVLGRRAEPHLRAARRTATSEEVRMRLDAILAKLTAERTASPEVIHARAVAALERAGTDSARKLLAEWAAGADADRLTRDAKAALARLGR